MILDTILVGVDFSEASDAVLEEALDLARLNDARLVFARICDLPTLPPWLQGVADEIDPGLASLRQARLDQERDALKKLYHRLSVRGLTLQNVLVEGRPAAGLLVAAEDAHADLIVVGHRGRTEDEHARLGGVAARVARTSPIPVLVARFDGHSAGGYRRVLVASDFSGASDRLLKAALTVSAPDAEIDLLHCWRLPMDTYSRAMVHKSPEQLQREVSEQIVHHARERGHAALGRTQPGERTLRMHLREARARTGVIEQLEEGSYDLVVVGSHGHGGFQPLTLGNTAAAVVRRAPTSALVVPTGER